jgi:hypothetical protein
MQRHVGLLAILAATAAAAVLVQTMAPVVGQDNLKAEGKKAIPDFSGLWRHASLPGMEPLASGPTSLRNLSRKNGVSNYDQLVGDYKNPILQPWASNMVKKFGELSKAGVTYPSPANQCWPNPLPFIYKNFALQLLQQPHQITMIYEQDHEFRKVWLNAQHPAKVEPSWHGHSVGHYDGDTLVIDTIGQKRGPFAMVDLFGTPYSDKLHIVERYRLIDYEDAKEAIDRDMKENSRAGQGVDPNYRGKFLQNRFTVEDPDVFTTPWSATITFGQGSPAWPETVCAENRGEFYHGEASRESEVPTAIKADF